MAEQKKHPPLRKDACDLRFVALVDGLCRCDERQFVDVFFVTTARQVVDRLVEALEDRSDRFEPAETLHHLETRTRSNTAR